MTDEATEQPVPVIDHEALKWTRHASGTWSSGGYEIKRQHAAGKWRVLRDGAFWDLIEKLPDAKRACVRDFERRQVKLLARPVTGNNQPCLSDCHPKELLMLWALRGFREHAEAAIAWESLHVPNTEVVWEIQ